MSTSHTVYTSNSSRQTSSTDGSSSCSCPNSGPTSTHPSISISNVPTLASTLSLSSLGLESSLSEPTSGDSLGTVDRRFSIEGFSLNADDPFAIFAEPQDKSMTVMQRQQEIADRIEEIMRPFA